MFLYIWLSVIGSNYVDMECEKIKSLDDFYQSLNGMPITKENAIYRGQSNIEWPLKPKLLRQNVSNDHEIFEKTFFVPFHQDINIPFLENKDPLVMVMVLQIMMNIICNKY
ncbi:MAG TPA: hypothetical protein DCM02_01570 [Flavobacterium sp.]|nr:hypothetical protein [Flavobacterium sp.]